MKPTSVQANPQSDHEKQNGSKKAFWPFDRHRNHTRPLTSPPRKPPSPGFAAFGDLLSTDPDLQIYHTFNDLASRNLAYLQSELLVLQAEIEGLDELNRREAEIRAEGWMEKQLPARCWEVLKRKAAEGCEKGGAADAAGAPP